MTSLNPSRQRRSAGRGWLLAAVPAALFVACVSADRITAPKPGGSPLFLEVPTGHVVISQVYGGGGNSGATYTNDFIELYNAGTGAVSLSGWSVQYGSSGGTSWTNKTDLTGSIAPGGYYLVQEGAGAGGTTALPTPNATGGIAMSGTAGKVALVSSTTALSGTGCPIAGNVVDFVGYGTTANCFEGSGRTPAPSNTLAVLRKNNGVQDTDDNAADFATGAPHPRNGTGGGGTTVGPLDHVAIAGGSSVNFNGTITLTAVLQDANSQAITDPAATYTWQSTDETIARVVSTSTNTATVKGLTVGGPVTITASATSNGVAKSGTAQLTVVPPVLGHITLSAGTTPLVIGYQTQIFVNTGSTDQSGNPVTFADVAWSSSAPAIVTVDSRGLVAAAGDGSAIITATALDGAAGSFTMRTEVPVYSSTARTGHNIEFGAPTDADPSNDIIIARKQYTLSYNPQRGGPNWVSWDLSATHLGTRNRCNCYTADTALARLGYGQFMYNTLDYTNGGYDRGHMEPSADQTTTDGENATTFFLTNFLAQKHGLNAGPWEGLENALRDSVRAGREAYVIAGGIFTNGVGLGSLKGESKIFAPDSTWKIVVMMPANTGLANVTSETDVDVFAVNMPNVDNPGTNDWTAYKTTVDKIQHSTGYDFLSALPEAIQCRVEIRNCAPTARISGDGVNGGTEGQMLSFAASTSSDPDAGTTLSYQWSIDGQIVGINSTLSHTFTNNDSYQIRLIVSDQFGGADTSTLTVTILNVAPVVSAFGGATLLVSESYSATGSFTDPGADRWTGTVSYGDAGWQPLSRSDKAFQLEHQYTTAGSYSVTVSVSDQDGGVGTRSASVVVLTPAQGVAHLSDLISALGTSGALNDGQLNSLQAKLDNAAKQLVRGNGTSAANMLGALVNELQALVNSGRMTDATAAPILEYAQRVIGSIQG